MKLKEIKKEADKSFLFNNSHNIMASQPKGVMAVSEARKLFNKLYDYALERLTEGEKNG